MKRVLVVNDSQFERMIMKDTVLRLGYDVKATDEYNTLDLLASYDPDIVITNLNMAETSGDKLIARIKQVKPNARCFLCSCSSIDTAKLCDAGIDGFFQTPITPGGLEKVLNESTAAPQHAADEPETRTGFQATAASLSSQEDKSMATDAAGIKKSQPQGPDAERSGFSFCPFCGQKIASGGARFAFCP